MSEQAHEILQRLYDIPIEQLDLSDEALRVMKWEGITSVGECIHFYIRDANRRANTYIPIGLWFVMYGEVKPRMQEQGYWQLVMDDEIWAVLEDVFWPWKMVVKWRDCEVDLYQVSIEELDLSAKALNALKQVGIMSIAECVNRFILIGSGATDVGSRFSDLMADELEAKLKEHDYWSFIEYDPNGEYE